MLSSACGRSIKSIPSARSYLLWQCLLIVVHNRYQGHDDLGHLKKITATHCCRLLPHRCCSDSGTSQLPSLSTASDLSHVTSTLNNPKEDVQGRSDPKMRTFLYLIPHPVRMLHLCMLRERIWLHCSARSSALNITYVGNRTVKCSPDSQQPLQVSHVPTPAAPSGSAQQPTCCVLWHSSHSADTRSNITGPCGIAKSDQQQCVLQKSAIDIMAWPFR
jgi:hypothetical protein